MAPGMPGTDCIPAMWTSLSLWNAASPVETRAGLIAAQLGAAPDKLISAAGLGDNLARAMIEKGLNADAFEAFGSRRRQ